MTSTALIALFLAIVGAVNCVALEDLHHHHQTILSRYRRAAPPRNYPGLLPDTLKPFHYDLRIRPDIYHAKAADFKFDGNVTIHFKCRRSTNIIKLHSSKLKINRHTIKVIGQDGLKVISMSEDPQREFVSFVLNRRLKTGQSYAISLQFAAAMPLLTISGLYASGYMNKNNTISYMAVSTFEPDKTRMMFPCFDEPVLKATFSIKILRKSSHTALSNMPLIRSKSLGSGWFEDSFEKTPLFPTYLASLFVTDFKFREGRTKQGVKIRVWWRDDQLDNTKIVLETAIKSTEWLTEYTGIGYKLPKMDFIPIPGFTAGGLENWGLISIDAGLVKFDVQKIAYSSWIGVTTIVIHEVAHQWFGNLVTNKWWNDIWINEGINTYMTRMCKAAILPEFDHIGEHITKRRVVFGMDAQSTMHPVEYSLVTKSEMEHLFDPFTYEKGALIMHMLHGVTGDKVFRLGIQLFLKKYAFGAADQYDFYDAFNEALQSSSQSHVRQMDVGEFMAPWIQQAGFPIVTIRHDKGGLSLNQSRYLADPVAKVPDNFKSTFGNQWVIPLAISTNSTGKVSRTPPFWMRSKTVQLSNERAFTHKVDSTWILSNLKGYYYTVNYDDRNRELVGDQLARDHKVFTETQRALMIEDSAFLVRAGKLRLYHSLKFMQYLRKEKDFYPWKSFLENGGTLGEKLRFSANYGIIRSYMLDLVAHMYDDKTWQPKTTAGIAHPRSTLDTMLLKKACQYDYKPCLDKAIEIYKNSSAQTIPTHIRGTVYCAVVKAGKFDVWDKVYAMYLDEQKKKGPLDPLVIDLATALSCSKDQSVLRRFLKLELERGINVVIPFAIVAVMNPMGPQVALKFALERWNDVKKHQVIDHITGNLLEQADLDMLLDFMKAHPEVKTGEHAASLDLAKKAIQKNIDWMNNEGQEVVDWLSAPGIRKKAFEDMKAEAKVHSSRLQKFLQVFANILRG